MSATVDSLLRDLLVWLDQSDRPYAEVMEAWRTSCPRMPVWEEASDRGFVARAQVNGETMILLSAAGRDYLLTRR
jgi:D-3-phosphoglycerate dehydrogenase